MLEDYGLTDTNTGLINRVARMLTDSLDNTINTDEFRSACYATGWTRILLRRAI